MTDTTFVDKTLPVVNAAWLNDVNIAVYRALGAAGVAPVVPADIIANIGAATPASAAAASTAARVTALALATAAAGIGSIQAGTGAVSRTVQAELGDALKPQQFGAVGDDTTDDYAAFAAMYTAAVASKKAMVIPAATYKLGTAWTISDSNVRVYAEGLVTLHFTNAGQGLIIDGGASSGSVYGAVFGGDTPIKIKGNALTTDVAFIRSAHHCNINLDVKDGITGCRVNFAVDTKLKVECSVNTGAFVLTPTTGLVLDTRSPAEYVAGCEIFAIIEGVSGTGIVGTAASFNNIRGGTSEGNAKGVTWGANCYLNNIYGTDFESNTTSDIEDSGNNNSYYGIRSGSAVANVILNSTCNGASFHGGYLRTIALDAVSKHTSFFGTAFSDNGALGITGAGSVAARVGCTRVNTSAVVTVKYADLVGEWGQTWTPAVASAGGGAQGAVTFNVGGYSVVGKSCQISFNLSVAQGTLGAGAISITGLPFQARNLTNMQQWIDLGSWGAAVALGAGYTKIALEISPNTTTAVLIKSGTGAAPTVVNLADFTGQMTLQGSGTYETV